MKIHFSRTKIIATIGPSSSSENMLERMIKNGVSVCRINFSHSSYDQHADVIQKVRRINEKLDTHVAILADLQGPKIRIGEVENNGILLKNNQLIEITTHECVGTSQKLYINYANFPKDVKPGEKVLLDDGKLMLQVVDTNKEDMVKAKVLFGGILSSKKGVNLPNTKISLPCLTDKDKKDLLFALEHDVEWIGLSFVRSAQDIWELRELIEQHNKTARIIAKIEKPEAIEDIDNIIKVTDAIMVARGDLGVEIPMQNVPLVQKKLIKKSLNASKPIIVATQLMESMIHNINPTRAEVNDVANSVMDGADALMLSGETSVGKHPDLVIESLQKIIKQIERYEGIYHRKIKIKKRITDKFIADAICSSACKIAEEVDVKAIITMTHSGYSAFKIASYRPKSHIIVFTHNKAIINQLSLIWGVRVFFYDKLISTDDTITDLKNILKNNDIIHTGDLVINIASIPVQALGSANMFKLSHVD